MPGQNRTNDLSCPRKANDRKEGPVQKKVERSRNFRISRQLKKKICHKNTAWYQVNSFSKAATDLPVNLIKNVLLESSITKHKICLNPGAGYGHITEINTLRY